MDLLYLSPATLMALLGAGLAALIFEAANGFHDAANSVATVIYTNSLKPSSAVVLSGICNFLGVYLGGMGVAFAVVHLLPVDLLVNLGSGSGTAMIFAILLAATVWNIGTWYKGIPASSSHTLIGAIIGVGLANAFLQGESVWRGINFGKVEAVFLSLLISPILGFGLAVIFLSLARNWMQDRRFHEPPKNRKPPGWVRALLVLTSSGVSLAHGSNDGQKGVGLVMIILIATLPAHYALNLEHKTAASGEAVRSLKSIESLIQEKRTELFNSSISLSVEHVPTPAKVPATALMDDILMETQQIVGVLEKHESPARIEPQQLTQLRKNLLLLEDHLKRLSVTAPEMFDSQEKELLAKTKTNLLELTDYAPAWVVLAVALAIGLGTMVGWKRVVVTVGERIGKNPLTYAQGASSQMVAMVTIGVADMFGLPVSTTHVLSSGVTGTMVANKTGLNYQTLRDIALAWIFTFPAATLLSAGLYILFRYLGSL